MNILKRTISTASVATALVLVIIGCSTEPDPTEQNSLPTTVSPAIEAKPNPPMDRDGRREDSGRGEGVTGAIIRARIRVDGRLAAVCRRFGGRRCRPAVAVASEMAG